MKHILFSMVAVFSFASAVQAASDTTVSVDCRAQVREQASQQNIRRIDLAKSTANADVSAQEVVIDGTKIKITHNAGKIAENSLVGRLVLESKAKSGEVISASSVDGGSVATLIVGDANGTSVIIKCEVVNKAAIKIIEALSTNGRHLSPY